MSRVAVPIESRRFSWVFCGLLVLVVFRAGTLIWLADSFQEDPDAYRRIAWTLDQSGTFGLKFGDGEPQPTAYRPPLYPWILSWLVIDAGDAETSLPAIRVGFLHLLAFAVTLLAVYQSGVRLLNRRAGLLACLLITLDPLLIRQSALVMTETIAVMLTSIATWWFVVMVQSVHTNHDPQRLSQRFAPWALAITLAIDFLCRPTFLVWAGLLAMACMLDPRYRRSAIAVTIVMSATVGLWAMRNARAVGHPVWATTHGGYTMLLSNNRFFYDYLREGWTWTAWDAGPFTKAYIDRHERTEDGQIEAGQRVEQPGNRFQATWGIQASIPSVRYRDGEVANDRWAGGIAKMTIRENPVMFAWSSCVRVLRLWSPIPLWTPERSTTSILAVGLYYVTIYAFVVVSLMKHGSRLLQFSWLPIWTLAIALTLVHSIYWTNLRMRCPIQPGIALLASAAFVRRRDIALDP